MPAYVIANIDIADPERYEEYKRQAQETIAAYGGRYLARGGRFEVVEGRWQPARLVILEFPSYERALEWWQSQEYGAAKELRQRISTAEIVVLEGCS